MIAGVGTDIIKIERVLLAYGRKAFRDRVYTEKEQMLIGEKNARGG